MSRGQSEVLGILLLFGMVTLGAIAILSTAISGLDGVQNEVESEHDLMEMENVAQEISTLSYTDQTKQVGVTSAYRKVDGGQLIVKVDGNEIHNDSMGRIVKDNLVYEGGIILKDGRIVRDSVIDSKGNSSRIIFPTITGDSFSGSLQSNGTKGIQVTDPTANVTVRIQSRYAATWAELFKESSADVKMVDEETVELFFEGGTLPEPPTVSSSNYFGAADTTVTLGGLSVLKMDSYESSEGKYEKSIAGDNAAITSPGDLEFAAEGGGKGNTEFGLTIEEIRLGGELQEGPNLDDDVSVKENLDDIPSPTPTSEIVDAQDPEQGDRIDSDSLHEIEEGGEFHTTGDLKIRNDLELEEGVSLFINGDLTIDGAKITAEEELRLFVTGDVTLKNGATIETADNPHRSTDVSIFTTGDIIAESGGGSGNSGKITGLVHGTDSTLTANGQIVVYGSATVGDVISETEPVQGGFTLHYDEDIAESESYETVDTNVTMEAEYTRDAYYLGIVIPEIEAD